ncbi:hypothetical protein ACP70R_005016 [Stipagrostis hirtigluma subsp. patula]
MSKRRAPSSDHECRRCAAKMARPTTPQKHLYVVLDDQRLAYSVHKLDVDDDAAFAGAGADSSSAARLPEPPFLRLEVQRPGDRCHFSALGDKIIAFLRNRPLATLVHDTKTAAMAIGSPPPPALSSHVYLTVAAADRLYVLPNVSAHTAGEMYYLEEEPPLPPPAELAEQCPEYASDEEEEMRRSWRRKQEKWAWSTVASSAMMPFNPVHATCCALHPDGRTFFVSVERHPRNWMEHGTFSFDAGRGVWTRHGGWLLPFRGRAFFDAELDAWVGLDERGHLCASNGVSRRGARRTPPAWRRGREAVLRERDPERRLGAALAHMGGGGRFCLVERAVRAGVETKRSSIGDGDGCVLYVSTFCVRYGKDGELTTTARRDAGCYAVSR